MNEFNDESFFYFDPEGEIMEFTMRQLLDWAFNYPAVGLPPLTKQEKMEIMRWHIADIEKSISIIEKDEYARLSEV